MAGITGRSYVFGFAAWTLGPIVGCLKAMTEMIAGDALAPFDIEAKLRRQLTLLDTPGLVGAGPGGHRHGRVGCAGAGPRGAAGHAARRRAQADPRLQQHAGCGSSRWRSSPTKPRPCWRRASRR